MIIAVKNKNDVDMKMRDNRNIPKCRRTARLGQFLFSLALSKTAQFNPSRTYL